MEFGRYMETAHEWLAARSLSVDVDFLSIPCLLRILQAKDASFNICKFKIIGF